MGNRESLVKEDEEEIAIKIYELVDTIYPEYSEKITGMLLESDHEELNLLLNKYPEELQNRIKLSAQIVQQESKIIDNNSLKIASKTDKTEDKESIGNTIYGVVYQLYPALAANVTGMLLEMNIEMLVSLLQDKDKLLKCIHQAAHVYMDKQMNQEQLLSTTDKHQNSTQPIVTDHNGQHTNLLHKQQEKEVLGEQIYMKIEAVHPNEAAKLTGMLLEMDVQSLKQILDNSALLDKKLHEALEVIHKVEKGGNGIANEQAIH